jgi:hypothetical protein
MQGVRSGILISASLEQPVTVSNAIAECDTLEAERAVLGATFTRPGGQEEVAGVLAVCDAMTLVRTKP